MDRLNDSPERRDVRRERDDQLQAALLIDFDNVTMGIRSNLGQELRNLLNSDVIRGKVAVQRAYADWRRYPQYIVPLSEASIDLIFAPAYGSSKKNATDIRLAIDALELVFVRPEIRTYILMSGDSDFSSLVLKLKEYGKYVIGVGIQESSSDLLVQNCDEYYSYSALSGLSRAGDQPLERHDPWALVEKAIKKMVERGDTMRSDRLKQVMIEIDPSFAEKELGYNKFNRFVVDAASRGLLTIQKMENGQYGVAPGKEHKEGRAEDAGAKAERPARSERPERPRRAARPERAERAERGPGPQARAAEAEEVREAEPAAAARGEEEGSTRRARPRLTMASAVELLGRALGVLLEGENESVRDSDVKRRMLELDPSFDETELGYGKFSKFLQAAHEEGAIELSRGPNGNFQVSRARKGRRRGKEAAAPGEPAARESPVKRLARFLFRASPSEEKGEAEAAQAPAPERQPEVSREEQRAREPRGARHPREPREPREPRGRGERERGGPRGRRDRRPSREREGRPREAEGRQGERFGERRPRSDSGPSRRGERGRRGERAEGDRRRHEGARVDEERPAGRGERLPVIEPVIEEVEAPSVASTEVAAASVGEARLGVKELEADKVAEEARQTEAGAARMSGVAPAPLPGAPRGTIRGRWGTRGRYRPAGERPPIFAGQMGQPRAEEESAAKAHEAEAEPEPAAAEPVEAGGPSTGGGAARGDVAAAIVARLTAYAGVGARTAEVLVEAFGSDTFRVLDEEPARVREVLPDHRAERVLEARRKERETGAA